MTSEDVTHLNEAEQRLVGCYETLIEVLRDNGDDLAPFAHRNAAKAAASLWQITNGLDLVADHPYDIGV